MTKGEDTKHNILEAGLDMSSQFGLESVSIGALSKRIGMSKSGLFAHFQSKENLQIELLNHAAQSFGEGVVLPALVEEPGVPRIKALVSNWIEWTGKLTGGCIFVSASTEFTDRPGKVRECLLNHQEQWLEALERIAESAIRVGDFRKDIDIKQFAFDLYSLLLGFHMYHKMLNNPETNARQEAALERLLDDYR